jgi:hypothetical protein
LFTELESEPDGQKFRLILQHLYGSAPEFRERVEARRQMPRSDWYIPAFERHGYKHCVAELAAIFRVLVIPDLDRPTVIAVLGEWVRRASPQVTAALLVAAKDADDMHPGSETFGLMTQALGAGGLQRYLEISGIPFEWPSPPRASDIPPGDPPAGSFWSKLRLRRD